jgi:hypothetical protein
LGGEYEAAEAGEVDREGILTVIIISERSNTITDILLSFFLNSLRLSQQQQQPEEPLDRVGNLFLPQEPPKSSIIASTK